MSELQTKLDEAAKELAKLTKDEFGQWASYLLEAIESEVNSDALEKINEILQERRHNGRW